MRKIKALFLFVLIIGLLGVSIKSPAKPVYAAVVTLNSWDLVDSGKHLDWDGRTNYMPEFERAVKTWNDYKPGVIRKDTIWIVEDVFISDYYEENETAAVCLPSGKIKFNQYRMDRFTSAQIQNFCAKMLGHALGLGYANYPCDIMWRGNISSVTSLSVNDKASYDAAYKRY